MPLGKRKIAMVYSNWVIYPVRTHHKNKKDERECIAIWRNPIGVHRKNKVYSDWVMPTSEAFYG
ncbi:hypothetical protein [Photobacterium leiognathi]|uniref:hypothetical protein n=1 Tax=Photobacterium leiognathi TaxID=553611 RepID=UPI002739F63A|nr:hypothetical protein [Photobacterium leiognathi]